jgi:O-acetyl-ADP-ribose deacetylase (regulator of RNase III)
MPTQTKNNINYLEGDATKPVGDGMKIIAHCCNNIGGWGSGFVLALSAKWEDPEKSYRFWHKRTTKKDPEAFSALLGSAQMVPVEDDIYVANLLGQNGVRGPDNPEPIVYSAIESGLNAVFRWAERKEASIHLPRIGCNLAGGSWAKVEEIINKCMKEHSNVPVFVYDFPGGTFNP